MSKNPFAFLSLAMLAALLTVAALPAAPINVESPAEITLAAIR